MLLFLYSSKKINLCEKRVLFEENYSLHCPATDLTRVLLLSAGGGGGDSVSGTTGTSF